MLQPQAASIQPVQAAMQQVTSQPSQVTSSKVPAAQTGAAQPTTAATSVSPSNISVAALQTAGLSINPAIVRRRLSVVCALEGDFIIHAFIYCSVQRCLLGSSAPVSQFPHLHSHHHQCNVQRGWYHQSDHHKRPRTGESLNRRFIYVGMCATRPAVCCW